MDEEAEQILKSQEVLAVLARHVRPDTNQPFANYTTALHLLIRSCIECYEMHEGQIQANAEGHYVGKLLAAYDLLYAEMLATLGEDGIIRQGTGYRT